MYMYVCLYVCLHLSARGCDMQIKKLKHGGGGVDTSVCAERKSYLKRRVAFSPANSTTPSLQ